MDVEPQSPPNSAQSSHFARLGRLWYEADATIEQTTVYKVYQFHVTIHACPSHVDLGDSIELDGRLVRTLNLRPQALATPMSVTFEQATCALATLPRMFVEPDGSFVWRGHDGQTVWQIDGSLYDGPERLMYVEIKGSCPDEPMDQLLGALGRPANPLVFQLVRHAVFLDESEFRGFSRGPSI